MMNAKNIAPALVVATAILLTAFAGTTAASEDLPAGVQFPDPGAQQKIKTYQKISRTLLKDKLTPLVEKTSQGGEFVGAQWVNHCNSALKVLATLKKDRAVPASLNKWYANEQRAWLNIRTIGMGMLDHHHEMACTHDAILQDAKDIEAFYKLWQGKISKANDKAGKIQEVIKAFNNATGDLEMVSKFAGEINSGIGDVSGHMDILCRVTRIFRARKFTFIKKHDLQGPYRAKLAKLKSKAIDPDGSGVFYTYEVRWEETMTKTFMKYVGAVKAWKEASRWYFTKEEWKDITAKYLPKLVTSGVKLAGFPLPSLSLADPDKMSDWIEGWKGVLNKALKKEKLNEKARLNDEIDKVKTDLRILENDLRARINQLEEEARMKAVHADQRFEKNFKQLAIDSQKAHDQLGKAGTDKQQEREAWKKIRSIELQQANLERARLKERHYVLEVWYSEQVDEAYDKFREDRAKLEKKLQELKKQQPK